MKNTTRKHIWPMSLVMGLAVIGALAAIVALTALPGVTTAQEPPPFGGPAPDVAVPDAIESSSTSGGAGVKLTLTIGNPGELISGSSVELYLEDDFQVPSDIDEGDVYFVGSTVGRVYATDPIEIDDDDHYGGDDDWSIQVQVPDLNPDNDDGFDAWSASETRGLQLVFTKSAGIKNPTEAGTHSVGYSILEPGDDANDGPQVTIGTVETLAKISLSDEEDVRGKEVTVTGSGFNNGTGAEVFVITKVAAAMWWEDLDCDGMKHALRTDSDNACFHLDEGTGELSDPLQASDAFKALSEAKQASYVDMARCSAAVQAGDSLGTAAVASDDTFTVTFTVHQDEFEPGAVNHICASDSEAGAPRVASATKVFELSPTITLDPTSGSYGDEITLKARDFDGQLKSITLGPTMSWTNDGNSSNDDFAVEIDSNDYIFDLPGGLDARTQVAAVGTDGEGNSETERAYLTVEASSLDLSKSEVVANESIIIEGRGFDDAAEIPIGWITLDDEPLNVERAGTESCSGNYDNNSSGRCIKIDSNGQFVVEARVWTIGDGSNPALDADTYTVKIVDSTRFEGEADITILEPTITVTPDTAGPRDYISISGENWPQSTEDEDIQIRIQVDGRNRTESVDTTGRFSHQVRLSSDIDLGEEHDINVTCCNGGDDIDEDATFMTPDSGISVSPAAARPGDTISIELLGMPVFTLVNEVVIAGGNRLGNVVVNTDRDGNASVSGILVPAVDPGFYSVRVGVGGQTAVAQLEILDDAIGAGAATALPAAAADLSDNLDAIFHFNNGTKEWTFFDPRPEFADLNTLTEMIGGEPYWVLVKAEQLNVDWNGKSEDFTCAGGDCWNLKIW